MLFERPGEVSSLALVLIPVSIFVRLTIKTRVGISKDVIFHASPPARLLPRVLVLDGLSCAGIVGLLRELLALKELKRVEGNGE